MEIDRAFLVRTLYAMEGVIDVADRKTDEFDEMRACIMDLTLMLYKQPQQQTYSNAAMEPIPAECDVRKIMLKVVPGEDGMGEEIFASSVRDVEDELSRLGGELEEWQLGIKRLSPSDRRYQKIKTLPAKSFSEELEEFHGWFNAVWLGDQEHGQYIPTQGDSDYPEYLKQHQIALGAWMKRAHTMHNKKAR